LEHGVRVVLSLTPGFRLPQAILPAALSKNCRMVDWVCRTISANSSKSQAYQPSPLSIGRPAPVHSRIGMSTLETVCRQRVDGDWVLPHFTSNSDCSTNKIVLKTTSGQNCSTLQKSSTDRHRSGYYTPYNTLSITLVVHTCHRQKRQTECITKPLK